MSSLAIATLLWGSYAASFYVIGLLNGDGGIYKHKHRYDHLKKRNPHLYRYLEKRGELCVKKKQAQLREDYKFYGAFFVARMIEGIFYIPALWFVVFCIRTQLF